MSTWSRLARPAFHLVAVVEAVTWTGLLIGMGAHYLGGTSRLGIEVFGALHGGAFIAYVLVTLAAARTLRWSPWTALLALAASLPPLATVVFEALAGRRGHLDGRWSYGRRPARTT
jgi:integral membrane protein